MNRHERRAHAKQITRRFTDELRDVPSAEWPSVTGPMPMRVLASRKLLVMVYAERHAICRLSICRPILGCDGRWVDGLSWDELQEAKWAAGFGDAMAVEVYPPDADVVCVANMRHLFVIEAAAAPFAWRKQGEHG